MCDCRTGLNEKLAAHNARLAFGFTCSPETNFKKIELSPPLIQLERVDKKKKNAIPTLMASFCPFCGDKYQDRS